MRRVISTVIAIILVSPAFSVPAHASGMTTHRMIPCALASTSLQRRACANIRALAAAHGVSGSDEAVGAPAICDGQSWASRRSYAIVFYRYAGEMHVTCNYPVDFCAVTMFASTSIPQNATGLALLTDQSTYCYARTLLDPFGVGLNFTATLGSCFSNGTFWVDPSPEEKLWA